MPRSFMAKCFNYAGVRLKPVRGNLLPVTVLLAWFFAPVISNAVEREVRMPNATTACIVNSGSTNTLGFTLTLAENGAATLEQGNSTQQKQLSTAIVGRFFAALRGSGPLDALPATQCIKSASFGTTTRIFYGGKASPDISCLSPNPLVQELASEATALLVAAGAKVVLRRPLPPDS
jgi:hypothetical protein